MSDYVNIQAAKTHLSKYVEQVAAGEEVIIAKAGKPMAKLVPYTPPTVQRTPGVLAGEVWISDDAFSEEADREIAADFYDSMEETGSLYQVAETPAEYGPRKDP